MVWRGAVWFGFAAGLKSVFLDADHRELCFFPGARLDGLVHRVRTFGVKVHEVFEGRDDHLIYRSVSALGFLSIHANLRP